MKRFIVLLVGAMMVGVAGAQMVEKNEAAILYYTPKTEVVLEFTYTMDTQEAGPFAEYAEELLGVANVVTENNTTYTLNDVHIGSMASADYTRPHKVSANSGIPLLLTINDKNVLVGYNVPCPKEKSPRKQAHGRKDAETVIPQPTLVAPFTEDILKSNDSTGFAESVAQQIFRIRETRTYLLNGEVEHSPADGTSMRLVLAELDKQEQALTELFVGKRLSQTMKQRIELQPKEGEQYLFFSAENGFTDGENVDADTIRIDMVLYAQQYAEPRMVAEQEAEPAPKSKKGKKAVESVETELSPIIYNLPGSGEVTVVYKGCKMSAKRLPIAQLGIDVPLPQSLFAGEKLPVIFFNEKTGNIISISK